MASNSITQFSSLINQQIVTQETLSEYLLKAEALTSAALCQGFLDLPTSGLHNYLWALNDLLEAANQLNQTALDGLLKNVPIAAQLSSINQ